MIKFVIKEKIKEHNLNRPQNPDNLYRILIIVFDDMIAGILINKRLSLIVTELLIRHIHFSSFYYTILFYCAEKY